MKIYHTVQQQGSYEIMGNFCPLLLYISKIQADIVEVTQVSCSLLQKLFLKLAVPPFHTEQQVWKFYLNFSNFVTELCNFCLYSLCMLSFHTDIQYIEDECFTEGFILILLMHWWLYLGLPLFLLSSNHKLEPPQGCSTLCSSVIE